MGRKKDTLSCTQVRHSIREYLQNEMSLKDAEDFVRHVRECEQCRGELEEYYAFSSALMQLETLEDTEKGDFFMNVEKRLERTESQTAKERKDHVKRRITYIVAALLIAAAMGVSFGI